MAYIRRFRHILLYKVQSNAIPSLTEEILLHKMQ